MLLKRAHFGLVILVAAVVPAAATTPEASLMAKAKQIIARRLIDPASLQMRNAHVVSASVNGAQQTILCGEYNSKNRFGGYTGFANFIFDPTLMKGVLSVNGDLKLDFFSVSGTEDMDHDPTAEVRAGGDLSAMNVQYRKYTDYAIAYLPACLAAK